MSIASKMPETSKWAAARSAAISLLVGGDRRSWPRKLRAAILIRGWSCYHDALVHLNDTFQESNGAAGLPYGTALKILYGQIRRPSVDSVDRIIRAIGASPEKLSELTDKQANRAIATLGGQMGRKRE
jgi:hypothetical protein